MDYRQSVYGSAVLVRVGGRIDLSNADALKDSLMAALGSTNGCIVVDLAGLDYISSAGLRSLMIAFKAGKAKGTVLAIAAPQPLVLEIFTISRFNLVFPLFATVRDALATLAPDAVAAFDAA